MTRRAAGAGTHGEPWVPPVLSNRGSGEDRLHDLTAHIGQAVLRWRQRQGEDSLHESHELPNRFLSILSGGVATILFAWQPGHRDLRMPHARFIALFCEKAQRCREGKKALR
jgi:hypothetical protein